MLATYDDMSLITILHPTGKAEKVIEAAREAGALFGTITESRANITKTKKSFFPNITVSPSMEKIMVLAHDEHACNVIQQCISATNIHHNSFGAVFGTPSVRVTALTDNVLSRDPDNIATCKTPLDLQKNLRLITCICQRGKADTIAKAAVNAGSTAPIVLFGMGHGIRERLGLLRIALNPEKEIINIIASDLEAYRIFDAMVEAGYLYNPGMGFIYIADVPQGYVNLQATISHSHNEATIEQIIKAIDDIKGTKNWRLSSSEFSTTKRVERPTLYDLVNLKIVTRRGLGEAFVESALAQGARGATIFHARLIGSEKVRSITGMAVNDEREIIDFNVTREMADNLYKGFAEIIEEKQSKNTFILDLPVPKALTYIE